MIMMKDQYYFRQFCDILIKKCTHVNHAWITQGFATLLCKSIVINFSIPFKKKMKHVLTISKISKIFFQLELQKIF